MKQSSILLLSALSVPALLAFSLPATEISFSMESGATLKKTFNTTVQLSLDDMNMTMNGQDPPMMPELDMTISTEMEIVIDDEYVAMGDGQPKQLKRTYDTLSMNTDMSMEMDMMGSSTNTETPMGFSSELEGEVVLFTLDSESGDYTASFPDDEGEEELLEGLTEDMDMRGFLPEGSVSEGDEWEVSSTVLANILAPGGNLKLLPEDVDLDDMMGMNSNFGSMSDWFTEELKGEVTATFAGVADGIALINLRMDISNAVDLTEMVQTAMEETELPAGAGDIEFDHMDIQIEFEGEGSLRWNLAGGHAENFEISGDFNLLMNMGMAVNASGMDMDIEQTMEMSGTMNETATFE